MVSAPLAIGNNPKCSDHREPQNQPAAGQGPEPALEAAGHGGGEAGAARKIMAKAPAMGAVGATIRGFYITR